MKELEKELAGSRELLQHLHVVEESDLEVSKVTC